MLLDMLAYSLTEYNIDILMCIYVRLHLLALPGLQQQASSALLRTRAWPIETWPCSPSLTLMPSERLLVLVIRTCSLP